MLIKPVFFDVVVVLVVRLPKLYPLINLPSSLTNFTMFKFILNHQVTAVLLCIGGIVMMAYAEGFEGPNAAGVILSIAAAIGAALYKVTSEVLLGSQTQPTCVAPVRKCML